jgi:tetratricopeptide (TPR) repeat protein
MAKPHAHVTRELFRAARRGEISYRHLAELLRGRLEELCPDCRRESQAERDEEVPVGSYREAIRRVGRAVRFEGELQAFQREAWQAPRLLETLRPLSPEQRLLRIRNSPERYANRVLCEELFDQARACLPDDPGGSRAWAEAAEAIAEGYAEPHPPHRVRALSFQANAVRAAGDFEGAQVLFRRARDLMDEHAVADLELGAELHSFLGSLDTDLRRFEQAAEHLDSAARLYRMLGYEEDLARVLLQLGILHRHLGNLEAALEADHTASGLISPESNPSLYLGARFNYAHTLFEAKKYQAARDLLVYDEDLFEAHADGHLRIRVRWLEARIAAAIGDPEEAERSLLVVREHFAGEGHGFNAAIACLHLAALYHQEGRFEELREAAGQAVQLFQTHEIHRDALAALLLLQEAITARRLTAETIQRVAAYLQEAQRDPTARFEKPN